jgi:hypothetical protein
MYIYTCVYDDKAETEGSMSDLLYIIGTYVRAYVLCMSFYVYACIHVYMYLYTYAYDD